MAVVGICLAVGGGSGPDSVAGPLDNAGVFLTEDRILDPALAAGKRELDDAVLYDLLDTLLTLP